MHPHQEDEELDDRSIEISIEDRPEPFMEDFFGQVILLQLI